MAEASTYTPNIADEKLEHIGVDMANNGVNGAPLARQLTVALTPEQYERLFFQPSPPRRGDLAKKFGKTLRFDVTRSAVTDTC